MRRNRFDPDLPDHVAVHAEPHRYTRETRRAAGYRKPVDLLPPELEGAVPREYTYPRYVRRHYMAMMPTASPIRRVRKQRARLIRLMRPFLRGFA